MVNDPEVGAIVVGSPTPFHAEQIIEAAKLGKHIFCEKVRKAAAEAERGQQVALRLAGTYFREDASK